MLVSLRFGCQIVTYGDVNRTIKYSMLTEKCGFDVISLPDHVFHPVYGRFLRELARDVFTILGAIGVRAGELFTFAPIKAIMWDKPFPRFKEEICWKDR